MPEDLHLEKLELFYQRQKVCGPINCRFSRGKINLVVGRAGSGKSTLLKAIAGFHNEVKGSISLDSQVFQADGNIALAFQNPENLFFNPTVGEEVCFALNQKGQSRDSNEEIGKKWLERWGLDAQKYWHKHPLELSGGEKRKVALSACTVLLPPVIMLDEPLAGLDYAGQLKLVEILEEIACDHIVLLVTHDPELLLPISSGILFLQNEEADYYEINQFIRNAVSSSDFYPLPKWYCQALRPFDGIREFPMINAASVHEFLQKKVE
ncbi:MAG: energy-coupling factor transport system ATP-binding protein [Clostridiales bacterium]|jgi:energy-coupling factor transporter ATP-binding protein EcfA2|nr:energy-coupling factor transport system ATP-binding protein [Clostridiales bacterium]MDN5280927.1 energy-coupling factor transport system ATP-binding protein [Candidatus Ozemobacter sp.]